MTNRPETPDILGDIMAGPPAPTLVALAAIVNDGGTQMRAGINWDTVKEYADAMRDGATFPPITLYHDGDSYWLADGFHRFAAWKQVHTMPGAPGEYDEAYIRADVRAGARRDAILHAAGANASHGLRRTNGDKRRAVDVLLRDPDWSQWSDREIARQCAVSHMFVSNLRKELTVNGLQSPTQRTGADGRTIETANIGANRPTPAAMLAVWELETTVREVYAQVYGGNPEPYATRDMRTGAQMRAGRFWLLCTQSLPANRFRVSDLVQAINNFAAQVEAQCNGTNTPRNPTPGDPDYVPPALRPSPPPASYTVPEAIVDKPLPVWVTGDDVVDTKPALAPVELPPHADAETRVRFQRAGRMSANDLVQKHNYGFGHNPRPPYGDGQVTADCGDPEAKVRRRLGEFATADDAYRAARRDLQERIAAAVPPPAGTSAEHNDGATPDEVEPAADQSPISNLPVSQRSDYESDEWYTPAEYIDAAKAVMGAIDLDPASSEMAQTVVGATAYLTKWDDGLAQTRWIHQRIWLNPPYSNPGPWIEKLVREHQAGPFCTEAIVLCNNATETSWFQLLLERFPVCLPARRLAFWRHDHANVGARQGQAFFYLGPNTARFQEIFSQFGPILRRLS